jgi:dephospho-CoA kinase
MRVIGVCGVPAGGKSAVAAILSGLGAVWINADRIAHQVLEFPEVTEQIVMRFGSAILDADGKIDRPRLGQIVFGDDGLAHASLRYLESVVHPQTGKLIYRQIVDAIGRNAPVVVLDIPLLFESGWDIWCDEVWFIDTPDETVRGSANRRGWTAETLERRKARQLPVDQKRRLSSHIIDNHGTLEQLRSAIEAWWQEAIMAPSSDPVATRRRRAHCQDILANDPFA